MSKNKKIIIVIVVVIILLLIGFWAYTKFKKTPAQLEKQAADLRATQAGAEYHEFMMSRVI